MNAVVRYRRGLNPRCLAVTTLVLAFAGSAAIGQVLTFSDQTDAAGLTSMHTPGDGYPTPMVREFTSGGAVGDFDRDGLPDVFIQSDGTHPSRLFINQGDGTFVDEAADWGLTDLYLGSGVAVGDYNNDGWLDIYVTSFGEPGNQRVGAHRLYRNNGDGTFTEVAEAAGVNLVSPEIPDGMGAAWGDYNGDGFLDLFVTGWVADSLGNRLFRNNGDSTFTDATADAGLSTPLEAVFGFGAVFCDMNGNRLLDLLVIGDFQTSRYFINNGDGTFTDFTIPSGTGLEAAGMGQTIADFNNDFLLDWYVTTIHWPSFPNDDGNRLYINQGGHTYTEIGEEAGVKEGGWGWGTVSVDFNNDGWTDLGETNGWDTEDHVNFPACLWINNGDLTFDEMATEVGFAHISDGRGMLRADFDRDGDVDVIIFSHNEPLVYLRNDLTGPNTNFLHINLDTSAHPGFAPDGYGAIIRVTAGGMTTARAISEGTHFLSQSELAAHFGLRAAAVADEVRIVWPDGQDTVWSNLPANRHFVLRPPLVRAALVDMNQTLGSIFSGTLADAAESDGDELVLQSQFGFTAQEPNVINVVFGFTAAEAHDSLLLSLESRLNNPGGVARLALRNWSNNQFAQVIQYAIGTTKIRELVDGLDGQSYVRAADRRVEVRARSSVIATFAVTGYRWSIDEITVQGY